MDALQKWLDAYLRAWASNDADDIRALFTEDATYAGGPLDPHPWVGRDTIVREWLDHRDEQGEWAFEGAPIASTGGVGVIEGRTRYSSGRLYANIWVVHLEEDGRARSFVEWFMEPGPVREGEE
jgi:ketosteroid isomerase-like protein